MFEITLSQLHLALEESKMKTVKFANSVDLDEVAQDEPPHLDQKCLLLVFEFSKLYSLNKMFFEILQI